MTVRINRFSGRYGFLSNMYTCRPGLLYLHYGFCGTDPHWYPSVEHAYQASKFPADKRHMFKWQSFSGPEAKRIGAGQGSGEWRLHNLLIMQHLLEQKFSEPYLKTLLLRTDDAVLIEGNYWHDNFWGQCMCDRCETYIAERHNHLGRLLGIVRWKLQHPELNVGQTT